MVCLGLTERVTKCVHVAMDIEIADGTPRPAYTGLEVCDLESSSPFWKRPIHIRRAASQVERVEHLVQAFLEFPESILQELVNAAVELCGADTAGISLRELDANGNPFYRWIATAGLHITLLDAHLPSELSACEICVSRGSPQLLRVSQDFVGLLGVDATIVTDGLMLPWQVDGRYGTLCIVAHGKSEAFDSEDLKMMRVLSKFAARGVRQQRHHRLLLEKVEHRAAAAMAHELAHDINNPLQALMNILYLASQDQSTSDTRLLARHMSNDLQRLAALVKNLLESPGRKVKALQAATVQAREVNTSTYLPFSPSTGNHEFSRSRVAAATSSAQLSQAIRLAAISIQAETSLLLTQDEDTLTVTSGSGTYDSALPSFAKLVSASRGALQVGELYPLVVHAVSDGSLLVTVAIHKNTIFLGLLLIHRTGSETLNLPQGYVLKAMASEIADQLESRRLGADFSTQKESIYLETRLRLLESVVVNTTDSILITEAEPIDEPGPCIRYANPAFTQVTGYTMEEVLGKSPRLLQGPLSGTEGPALIRAALKAWKPIVVELLNYKKDGSTFWVELSIAPVCDDSGWYTHWISVQRDVTERKALEALPGFSAFPVHILLMASETSGMRDYLAQSLGQGYQITPVLDAKEVIQALEPPLPDLILLDVGLPHAAISDLLRTLKADPNTALIPIILLSSTTNEGFRQAGMEAGANDYLLKPFSSRELKTRVRTQLELIALRRAAVAKEDLLRAADALRQSEKLAVVGRLASSIAHEINNPLEAVVNLLFLAESTLPDSEARGYVRQAQAEVSRITTITQQTLKFHRHRLKATETQLCEVIDGVLTLFRGRLTVAGLSVECRYRTRRSILALEGDLRQVFANLIGNAIDASGPNGRIVVRLRDSKDAITGSPGVRVTIADTGHGMHPETRKRIFEAFFTTKDSSGTGLGLWVTAGILKGHGAAVLVRSSQHQRSHGTVFSVFFPANYAAELASSIDLTSQSLPC